MLLCYGGGWLDDLQLVAARRAAPNLRVGGGARPHYLRPLTPADEIEPGPVAELARLATGAGPLARGWCSRAGDPGPRFDG